MPPRTRERPPGRPARRDRSGHSADQPSPLVRDQSQCEPAALAAPPDRYLDLPAAAVSATRTERSEAAARRPPSVPRKANRRCSHLGGEPGRGERRDRLPTPTPDLVAEVGAGELTCCAHH